MPPNILSTCSVIDRNFANKLWNAGKYIRNCLASSGAPITPTTTSLSEGADSTASTAQELAVTGPMTSQELSSLPVPERYIVSRCHEVVQEVTRLLEALSFSDAGSDIGCCVLWFITALEGNNSTCVPRSVYVVCTLIPSATAEFTSGITCAPSYPPFTGHFCLNTTTT
jgi:hypothetical protein